ncbi:hypothetical protein ABI077_15305, partial [Enterococcus faecium]|uniref:hypothetical protein n=1 Tax=Enterococcus faecium TaxID=1352 RepID=UPI003F438BF7
NIIIGKLIPAGTGMTRYRDLIMDAPDAEHMTFWSSEEETGTEDLAAWLASIGPTAADDGTGLVAAPGFDYGTVGGDIPAAGFGPSGEES